MDWRSGLVAAIFLQLCLSQTVLSSEVRVRLGDSRSVSSLPCGGVDRPCAALSLAMQSLEVELSENDTDTTYIILLPSSFDQALHPESLDNVSDVVIDGRQANQISLSAINGSNGTRAWLTFAHSSNVLITNLNVSMTSYDGGAGLLFESCQNVTLFRSVFHGPELGTQIMNVTDSWPISVEFCDFIGEQRRLTKLEIASTLSRAALVISLRCSPLSCLTLGSNDNGFNACCQRTASFTQQLPKINFHQSSFRRLGTEFIFHTYYGVVEEQASAMYARIHQAKGVTFQLSQSNISENISPYDSPVKIHLENTNSSQVIVRDCIVKSNEAESGAGIVISLKSTSYDNEINVTGTLFFNNTANLQAGALAIFFYSNSLIMQSTNRAYIRNCEVLSNLAGRAYTVYAGSGGAFLIFSGSRFDQQVEGDSLLLLPHVTVANCTFLRNSAYFGSTILISGVILEMIDM